MSAEERLVYFLSGGCRFILHVMMCARHIQFLEYFFSSKDELGNVIQFKKREVVQLQYHSEVFAFIKKKLKKKTKFFFQKGKVELQRGSNNYYANFGRTHIAT